MTRPTQRTARSQPQAQEARVVATKDEWATQFSCPKCGSIPYDCITTKKTCITCGSSLIRWLEPVTILVIPGDPPSLNNQMRGKRRDIIREKVQWQTWVHNAWLAAGQPTFEHPVVRVRCYFATKRRRDRENYTMKSLIDQLTKDGAWSDDNADVFTQLPTEFYLSPDMPRVEIVIKEREAA